MEKRRHKRNPKQAEWSASWKQRNPEAAKAIQRRANRTYALKQYGLTLEDFDKMVAEQGGACAICGTVPEQLCVDHCHEKGVVRGLLCSECNAGLGKLGDTIGALERAVAYLRLE